MWVVWTLSWPSSSAIVAMSTPLARQSIATAGPQTRLPGSNFGFGR
jgi:hypothetical protein